MRLTRCAPVVLVLALELSGCGGDHYEGGGRRQELPSGTQTETPNVGPGDGSSSTGGTSSTVDGAAGAAVVPQGGAE